MSNHLKTSNQIVACQDSWTSPIFRRSTPCFRKILSLPITSITPPQLPKKTKTRSRSAWKSPSAPAAPGPANRHFRVRGPRGPPLGVVLRCRVERLERPSSPWENRSRSGERSWWARAGLGRRDRQTGPGRRDGHPSLSIMFLLTDGCR